MNTPTGASGSRAIDVAMLRRSSRPSQAYGIHLLRFTMKKNAAMVAVNTSGGNRIGNTYAFTGGPPACDTKLVNPEVIVSSAPSHVGGWGLSGRGGNSKR